MISNTSNRRYELDWLRILAILTVFLYHSSRFFNLGDWHVKNGNTFVWVEIWNVFATRWMMPLFFIISGASLFYAIGKSSGWSKFYVNKILRLMIPVLIASVTHSALQVYLERLTHGQFSGSFFSFLPEYFNGVYLGIGMSGNFAFHGMHLWYLLFLFVYSLLCYPLFIWLKGSGREILNRITSVFTMPGLIYIGFSIPLLIMKMLIPHAVLDVGNGGWGFLYYIWFLISGFMIVSSDRLQQHIMNQRWISLLLGVGLSATYLYLLFSQSRVVFPAGISDWIYVLLSFFSAWSWLFAILGFSMRFLAFDRPLLRSANEGVLPFFILHQTVLLCIGYFVMTWEINDALKWAIVFTSSFIAIITFYMLFVRKLELFRFLFGMKTTHPFFEIFRKRIALIILHVLFVGLIVFAVVNMGRTRSAMPLMYDSEKDILLSAESITAKSSTGVRVVNDAAASNGKAIEFFSGASQHAQSQPEVYVEMRFSAPTGRYIVWLRGKTDVNNGYTDSVWVQVDDQIGTQIRSARMGNWLDVHPAGVYGWAGDTDDPVAVLLKHTGDHTIRIQPRQTPHRIDQIWLSRSQHRIPNTVDPIK
ncbi:MAG: acyltransferase [Deltaproteobacteria bacterium]|nr:acyltransferase [Deltaproteobacteria bacterium]